MPPPTHVPDLLDRIRRSGIVPVDRLDGFLAGLQTAAINPETPAEMLERLVAAGLITRFHAEKLAAGKYKGFQLGSYLILDQIGTGGMGQVYLAEHARMRRLVALKVLPVFSSDDHVARERFFREARAAGTLDHPNVVRVFDLCQEGKLLYLVMEYVEGASLQSIVGRHGPLPVEAACHYARQVAFGLQHAHELGFVHRDIKPANLLIDRLGVAKILDLGLVRSEADREAALTKQLDNRILGTADYVAPEQAINSSDVDIRADIYSLGATLYFLLTGRTLFPEGRTAQKLVWQQIKEPVPVERLRPEVSPELAGVVNRMLRKKPAERFQTPAEVFEALAPFVPDEVPPPDSLWLPETSARVAMARAVMPSMSAPAVSGSTSQILAAAFRGGSGSGSSARRVAERVRDSSHLSLSPSEADLSEDRGVAPTRAMSLDDTQGTPEPNPGPDNPTRGLKIAIGFLAAALVVSLGVLAIRLLS
jgi:eukaryotic-like serine/threonine-protein kinase